MRLWDTLFADAGGRTDCLLRVCTAMLLNVREELLQVGFRVYGIRVRSAAWDSRTSSCAMSKVSCRALCTAMLPMCGRRCCG